MMITTLPNVRGFALKGEAARTFGQGFDVKSHTN
jgi:hypothetical protein